MRHASVGLPVCFVSKIGFPANHKSHTAEKQFDENSKQEKERHHAVSLLPTSRADKQYTCTTHWFFRMKELDRGACQFLCTMRHTSGTCLPFQAYFSTPHSQSQNKVTYACVHGSPQERSPFTCIGECEAETKCEKSKWHVGPFMHVAFCCLFCRCGKRRQNLSIIYWVPA